MQEQKGEADYWGRFAGTYDDTIDRMMGKEVRLRLADILDREHGLGEAVEFGCGTGYFTRIIARNAKNVTATDISPRMIDFARNNLKKYENVNFQVQNSESTTLPSEAYDTALMANMLHALDDPVKALKECRRVLKPGGALLIINYTEEGMSRVERTLLFFRFALRFGFPPRKNWPITSQKLRSFLSAAGFTIERMDLIKGRLNALYVRAKKE